MKKISQSSESPSIIRITSRADAIAAFTRGDMLSKGERQKVMADHFKSRNNMSLQKACVIALKYGLGFIGKEKAKLYALTSAWLRLGENVWQAIVTEVRKISETIVINRGFVRRFCQMFQKVFAHHKPSWAW